MRQVYPTNEVFHLWAHQTQESARNSPNVHFTGPELYSYSTTIAAIIDNIVYISENNMSVTTAKHISKARQASHHMEQFSTTAFRSGSNPRLTHEAMILPAARSAVQTLEHELGREKTRKQTKLNVIAAYIQERERITKHAARFNASVIMPEMTLSDTVISEYQAAKAASEAAKEASRIKAQKKQQREDNKQFNIWLTTGAGSCPYSFRERNNDFITIKGDYVTYKNQKDYPEQAINQPVLKISTSQGAECPLDHAVKALRFWESRIIKPEHGHNPNGDRFNTYHTNGHKIPLGVFTLDSIDEAGTVKAGCHTFSTKEIQRFINQWKEVLKP